MWMGRWVQAEIPEWILPTWDGQGWRGWVCRKKRNGVAAVGFPVILACILQSKFKLLWELCDLHECWRPCWVVRHSSWDQQHSQVGQTPGSRRLLSGAFWDGSFIMITQQTHLLIPHLNYKMKIIQHLANFQNEYYLFIDDVTFTLAHIKLLTTSVSLNLTLPSKVLYYLSGYC